MEWYCAVWNLDELKSSMGAQYIYDRLCEGDQSLFGDIDIIDEFYDELLSITNLVIAHKGKGCVVISCEFEHAEEVDMLVQSLAKKHGLSYYEPQNMTYRF